MAKYRKLLDDAHCEVYNARRCATIFEILGKPCGYVISKIAVKDMTTVVVVHSFFHFSLFHFSEVLLGQETKYKVIKTEEGKEDHLNSS